MKSHIIRILSFLFMFVLISCEKEKVDKNAQDYMVIDTSSTDYDFKKNIDKEVYASLWGSSSTDYSIDLDNDEKEDLKFSCSVYHHTVYDEWYSGIEILNENITVDSDTDTVQYANYFEKYFISPEVDSGTIYYKENYNSAKQYPSNVTITTNYEKFPAIHSLGDTLNERCNWKSGGSMFEYADHSWGAVTNNLQSGAWRANDHKFIGIRFVVNSIPYYGWIEIGVNDFHISLYKYALNNK